MANVTRDTVPEAGARLLMSDSMTPSVRLNNMSPVVVGLFGVG
ncbi:MAG TPA: hypothetical protein VFV66_17700 [Nonomuraea sp.]|nr:hypothetical protein [Nonomuraea sp.]